MIVCFSTEFKPWIGTKRSSVELAPAAAAECAVILCEMCEMAGRLPGGQVDKQAEVCEVSLETQERSQPSTNYNQVIHKILYKTLEFYYSMAWHSA